MDGALRVRHRIDDAVTDLFPCFYGGGGSCAFDRQKFLETYGSPEVAIKVAQARELLKTYDVRAVPTFVVDGKFLTSARLAGGTKQMIQVVDHLVKLAREERPR